MRPNRGIWLLLLLVLAAAPASAMDLDDVFALLNAGVGEDVILDQMESESASFLLETDDILALRRSGASDQLLRAMIESGDTRRAEREAEREAGGDWTEDYYAVDRDLRVEIAYDPFGYHWYASPSYFVYYYPFRTWDVGCYYAGWYHWRWWGWNGYWPSYYRNYCDSYSWQHHHQPYYHSQNQGDYRDNVRYRSRYDRAADGKPLHDRSRTEVRDRVTRSRSPRDADLGRTRTRSDAPASRTRSVDRPRQSDRSRGREVTPRPSDRGRSTPSQPSRTRTPSSPDRSNDRSGGRSR